MVSKAVEQSLRTLWRKAGRTPFLVQYTKDREVYQVLGAGPDGRFLMWRVGHGQVYWMAADEKCWVWKGTVGNC